jgi:dTDP-glucose 4,6-dehydratase
MTIIVTGGAGFIGSNFIFYLLKNHPDYKIVCLDKLTYAGNLSTLKSVLDRIVFEKVDICDRDEIDRVFREQKPDVIVNFAAESHVDRSIEDPEIFLRTNILGTAVLMDACRKYGIKRFHQVGTDEVYGDLPLDRPDLFFTEKTPIHTSSPYSASKASADLLVMAYGRTYKLPVTISRCSNNYGPYQFPEKLIPLMINNARKHEKLPIYGDGQQIRDWLFTEDHCKAIDMVLFNGRVGEVYNIGGHNEKTNLFIVETVIRELSEKLHDPGINEGLIAHVEDRPGHDVRYAIDPEKIKNELGWYPETCFEKGIIKTIDWYINNEDWLKNVTSGDYTKYYSDMYGRRGVLKEN